jgi:hypothetical protein
MKWHRKYFSLAHTHYLKDYAQSCKYNPTYLFDTINHVLALNLSLDQGVKCYLTIVLRATPPDAFTVVWSLEHKSFKFAFPAEIAKQEDN